MQTPILVKMMPDFYEFFPQCKPMSKPKADYMHPSPWKRVPVKNNTERTLKNGRTVPTFEAMVRKLNK